jgi:hypothetical protein
MPDAPAPSPALLQAVADLHRAAFTGLVLATVARRGTPAAADLVFAVFRRQHHERFLPGLQKLGLVPAQPGTRTDCPCRIARIA